jgi:hypothetical protein
MRITDKREFYRLSRAGLLGNRLEQWTYNEMSARLDRGELHPDKKIGVRHTGPYGGKSFTTTAKELGDSLRGLVPINQVNLMFDDSVDDDDITLQGEVMLDTRGFYLRHPSPAFLNMHQRAIWNAEVQAPVWCGIAQHTRGLSAKLLIQRHMEPASWDFLNDVLSSCDDAVVEFSCFNHRLGILNQNTLFWEVRTNY